jgi:hypothetical protein
LIVRFNCDTEEMVYGVKAVNLAWEQYRLTLSGDENASNAKPIDVEWNGHSDPIRDENRKELTASIWSARMTADQSKFGDRKQCGFLSLLCEPLQIRPHSSR